MYITAWVALALTLGSLVMPAASHRATVAMPWAYMLLVPRLPPDPSLAINQFSPFSTVFLYFFPVLWVSPAARNGNRAKPVEATLSLLDPSHSHDPTLRCLRA